MILFFRRLTMGPSCKPRASGDDPYDSFCYADTDS